MQATGNAPQLARNVKRLAHHGAGTTECHGCAMERQGHFTETVQGLAVQAVRLPHECGRAAHRVKDGVVRVEHRVQAFWDLGIGHTSSSITSCRREYANRGQVERLTSNTRFVTNAGPLFERFHAVHLSNDSARSAS